MHADVIEWALYVLGSELNLQVNILIPNHILVKNTISLSCQTTPEHNVMQTGKVDTDSGSSLITRIKE